MAADRLPLVIGANNIKAEIASVDSIKSPNDLVAGSRSGTGGGELHGRHLYLNTAGGAHWYDVNGSLFEVFRVMADGQPAAQIQALTGPVASPLSKVAFAVDIATGQLNATQLATRTAVSITDGKPGAGALAVGSKQRALVSGNWALTGWKLVTDASGSLRVEVRKQAYSSYAGTVTTQVSGTSTSTGGMPRTSLAIKASAMNISLWPDPTLTDGDLVEVEITLASGAASWYALQLIGTKIEGP